MKENTLQVHIDRPVEEVFRYTLDSASLPKWFGSIAEEIANETPVKLGTILRNRGYNSDEWNEVKVVEFVPNESFTLAQTDGAYRVQYKYVPNDGGTDFTYYEWVGSGNLDSPTDQSVLEKLKSELEGDV